LVSKQTEISHEELKFLALLAAQTRRWRTPIEKVLEEKRIEGAAEAAPFQSITIRAAITHAG